MKTNETKKKVKEIPFKMWCFEEAKRLGMSFGHIQFLFYHGGYPNLKRRHLNKRVVLVTV